MDNKVLRVVAIVGCLALCGIASQTNILNPPSGLYPPYTPTDSGPYTNDAGQDAGRPDAGPDAGIADGGKP